MSSLEEQIEITKNTLEVLLNEKKKRDEELLKNNNIVKVLTLVQSLEKRLDIVEKKIDILNESDKFNNLDEFPKEILGNLTSCFNNLTKNMNQININRSNDSIPSIPFEIKSTNVLKEVDLPDSGSDTSIEIELENNNSDDILEVELDNAFEKAMTNLSPLSSPEIRPMSPKSNVTSTDSDNENESESGSDTESSSSITIKEEEKNKEKINERLKHLLINKKVNGISPKMLERLEPVNNDNRPASPRLKSNPFARTMSNTSSPSSSDKEDINQNSGWNFFS